MRDEIGIAVEHGINVFQEGTLPLVSNVFHKFYDGSAVWQEAVFKFSKETGLKNNFCQFSVLPLVLKLPVYIDLPSGRFMTWPNLRCSLSCHYLFLCMCPVIPYFSVLHVFPLSLMAVVMISRIYNNHLRCKPV
jgi:hypothetical protein